MVVGCQPYTLAAFTPRKYSWYSFLLEAESTPGPQCDRKDFMSMKNPLTPVGIQPATFWFVAQHLNHCATAFSKVHRQNAAFSLKEKCPVHKALFRKGLSISKFVVLSSVYKVHISDLHQSKVLYFFLGWGGGGENFFFVWGGVVGKKSV